MTTRAEQKAERRKQILAAGLDLFIGRGLTATKVSDIADAVGMSVGLLFHYFSSKEQLYEELVSIGLEKSKSKISADNCEPLAFFRQISEAVLVGDLFTAKMFVLMNQAASCEQLSDEVRDRLKQDNFISTAKLIAAGQANGTIRNGEPLALAIAFWGAVQGVCQIIVQDPELPRPSAEWLIRILKLEG
jgi:AcrR family transcriptional regulator